MKVTNKIQNQLFKNFISQTNEYAILFLDLKGNIQTWNKGAEIIKGYKEEEIIGKNFKLFYTQKDQQENKHINILQKALKEKHANDKGWRVRKNGEIFWAVVTISAVFDDNGNCIGFSKITRDLTTKIKDEEKFKNLMNFSLDAIIIINKEGIIQDGNEQIKKHLVMKKKSI